jgi:hypothetical protein
MVIERSPQAEDARTTLTLHWSSQVEGTALGEDLAQAQQAAFPAQPPKPTGRVLATRTSQPKGALMASNAPASTGHLDMTIMLAFHDAFRRDLSHLARAASRRRTDLQEPARRTAIRTGWELFKAQLHLHHTGEDSDLWPRMRAHLAGRPDDLALLQAMEDEHGRISPILAASTRLSPTAAPATSGWPTRSTP